MRTATFHWALGSTCSKPRAVGLAAGVLCAVLCAAVCSPPAALCQTAPPASQANVGPALEIELARQPDLYLVVDPGLRTVAVKARGVILDTVPLTGFTLLGYRRSVGGQPPAPVALPAVWTVEEDAAAAHRRLIAPKELTPYPGDEAAATSAAAAEEPVPELPAAYAVQLDGGWRLHVGRATPATGLLGRWRNALADGWAVLRGRAPATPNLLALALAEEDARRLHHLLRPGFRILVAAGELGPPLPPATGETAEKAPAPVER